MDLVLIPLFPAFRLPSPDPMYFEAGLLIRDQSTYLLDGDGGLPALLLVQQRQANGARRVDVRVKQWRFEFACDGVSTVFSKPASFPLSNFPAFTRQRLTRVVEAVEQERRDEANVTDTLGVLWGTLIVSLAPFTLRLTVRSISR